MNIIPFDGAGAKLPAYLKSIDVAALNADLTAHASQGFPVLSIKGKVWAIVRDGERDVVTREVDGEQIAAPSLDVVLIKASKVKAKTFYMKGYDPNAGEKQKPDCYSNDGIAPAADAASPQAKKCATCAHNQFGSRMSADRGGVGKGKACADVVRLAVAPAGQVNDPMLLRVPPASLKALGEYGTMLAKRGVAYNMVVTKLGFDKDAESPKLTFKPVGFLDDASYKEVQEVADSDLVANIIGGSLTPAIESVAEADAAETTKAAIQRVRSAPPPSKAKEVSEDEVLGAIEAAAPAPAPARAKAKPAPAPAPVVENDLDIDLDGISFDD